MPKGTVKWFNPDKGFGFIEVAGGEDVFVHINELKRSGITTLTEGTAVEFRVGQSPKGHQAVAIRLLSSNPNQHTQASKPAQGNSASNVSKPKSAGSAKTPAIIKEVIKPPYHFVPVPTDGEGRPSQAITAKPMFHDGASNKERLSGELRCTLTALTPLLAANDQYEVWQIKGEQWRKDKDGEPVPLPEGWGIPYRVTGNKKVLEPLRLKDGRVVVSGTALKGMLRQSLGALLGAPMERVGDGRIRTGQICRLSTIARYA